MNLIKNVLLKKKFKNGIIIPIDKLSYQQERDKFLVGYSIENNIPIVISQQKRWSDLKYININVKLYRLAENFTLEVKKAEVKEVLIDESVDIEMITWLKDNNIKICGGFQ